MNDWLGSLSLLIHELNATMPLFQNGIRVLCIFLIAWIAHVLAVRLLGLSGTRLKQRKNSFEEIKRIDTLVRVSSSVIRIIIWLVAATVVLSSLGFSIAPILTTAGVSGIAVGFAAQSLIKDYFSGLILLTEGQMRVGDIVDIGGAMGEIEEITLRYVRLRNLNGEVIFVPNGNITNVVNKSLEYAYSLIDVGIAYRENVDEALEVMKQTAINLANDADYKVHILDVPDLVAVQEWADSAVILRLRIKVCPGQQWDVRREFLRRLKHAFDSHDIEIPYPHLTLYAGQTKDGGAPPLRVHCFSESVS